MADTNLPFGDKKRGAKEKPGSSGAQNINELSNQIANTSRRLRILEEKYDTLRSKSQLSDKNVLDFQKDVNRELKITREEISDFHKELIDIKDKLRLVVKELKECAKSDELGILKNYIQMWEPLNFVTQKEVDRLIEEKFEEKMNTFK